MAFDVSGDPGDDRVRVICRVRPRSAREVGDAQYNETLEVEHHESSIRVTKNAWDFPESFVFDAVLPTESSQRRVYDSVCSPVVEQVLAGKNGAVIAYGQTGTGKTYSLLRVGEKPGCSDRGVVVRAFEEIFARASADGARVDTKVVITYVQIHNEEVYDLLSSDDETGGGTAGRNGGDGGTTTPLRLAQRGGETFADGAVVRIVESRDDVLALLRHARGRRGVVNHQLNTQSSRSHAVLSIYVSRETTSEMGFGDDDVMGISRGSAADPSSYPHEPPRARRLGKLTFVDLAGSERPRDLDSGAFNKSTYGQTVARDNATTEAGYINKSLTALGKCVYVLAERGRRTDGGGTLNGHVPYRDSKLTRLLSDYFGDGSRVSLLVTVSSDPRHVGETVGTLKFGARAMCVNTTASAKKSAHLKEYKHAVRRQASEVDRLTFKLEDALAAAKNAKAEAIAELERDRIKIERELVAASERRVQVETLRIEDDAEAKAKAMVREVTAKVVGMLEMERKRRVNDFEGENKEFIDDAKKVKEERDTLKTERNLLQKEHDELAVALASTTTALDTALKRCSALEKIVREENGKVSDLKLRAVEAETLVDKLATRLAKVAEASRVGEKNEKEMKTQEDGKKSSNTPSFDENKQEEEEEDAAQLARALGVALSQNRDSGREKGTSEDVKNATRALARFACDPKRHAEMATTEVLGPIFGILQNVGAHDEPTLRAAASVLANVASSPVTHFALLEGGNFETLTQILSSESSSPQTKLLITGCAANLMGNPSMKQAMVDSRVFHCVLRIAATRDGDEKGTEIAPASEQSESELRVQATRAVSNFCARHPGAGDAIVAVDGALEGLIHAAGNGAAADTRKHAVLALYHMTRQVDLARTITRAGGVGALKKAIDNNSDSEETKVLARRCLHALEQAGA